MGQHHSQVLTVLHSKASSWFTHVHFCVLQIAIKTKFDDKDMLKHMDELLTELGPGARIVALRYTPGLCKHVRCVENFGDFTKRFICRRS